MSLYSRASISRSSEATLVNLSPPSSCLPSEVSNRFSQLLAHAQTMNVERSENAAAELEMMDWDVERVEGIINAAIHRHFHSSCQDTKHDEPSSACCSRATSAPVPSLSRILKVADSVNRAQPSLVEKLAHIESQLVSNNETRRCGDNPLGREDVWTLRNDTAQLIRENFIRPQEPEGGDEIEYRCNSEGGGIGETEHGLVEFCNLEDGNDGDTGGKRNDRFAGGVEAVDSRRATGCETKHAGRRFLHQGDWRRAVDPLRVVGRNIHLPGRIGVGGRAK